MLFIKVGDTYKSLACATNHTLTVNAETSDVSHKDIEGGWKASSVKSLSWEIQTENLFATGGIGYKNLINYMIEKKPIYIHFEFINEWTEDEEGEWTEQKADYVTKEYSWTTLDLGWTGEAIITNITLNTPNGDNASYTCTLEGVGPLHEI
ncbi:MAG: phage tail protein [Clostridia bacterium]|nr:phage tail protein [Clostridia bacterium]